MPTLICDCNKTMPLQEQTLGAALGEKLTRHSSLCRREAGQFQQAIRGTDDVVVACTQERRLFGEIADSTEGAVAPLRFVNIRETGGWSRDASKAMPKIAALLAAAHLPQPEPAATVSYNSRGRLVVIGPLEAAERAAALLGDSLETTLFATGGAGAQERRYPVASGRIESVTGWLGAFGLRWSAGNPIDLDLCTRCNACVAACPEGAIGLDYQVDLAKCASHRACVKVCEAAGAIDFQREPRTHEENFDLVLDLRPAPAFLQHAKPQGYFHVPAPAAADPVFDSALLQAAIKLRDLVGEFEKPRFFAYKQKLCAHSRNEKVACKACIDICSAEAIASDFERQQVKVNPSLCVGCGACTTVCPTGAMTYAYPRPADTGLRWKTLLSSYARAGGRDAVLLLHGQERGQALVEELGRAAQLGVAQGVPASVIPVAQWHSANTGIELWLAAIAWGAAKVAVLVTPDDAPQYRDALREQMAVAQAVLEGLGYGSGHFSLIEAKHLSDLDQHLALLAGASGTSGTSGTRPRVAATFAAASEKRATLEFALDHLMEHAPAPKGEAIALPSPGSPLGTLVVDKARCTLCLSCVSACPASALQDNALAPQLRFIEKNCVQCGLCATTCPEDAITLEPRLLLRKERKEARVLNEMPPYACIRCSKPFGTVKAIEAMLGKLAGHSMFQGEALERLKMCGDCRVIDIHSSTTEVRITDI